MLPQPRRIRFSPPAETFTLCHYSARRLQELPLFGSYNMKVWLLSTRCNPCNFVCCAGKSEAEYKNWTWYWIDLTYGTSTEVEKYVNLGRVVVQHNFKSTEDIPSREIFSQAFLFQFTLCCTRNACWWCLYCLERVYNHACLTEGDSEVGVLCAYACTCVCIHIHVSDG